MRAPSASAKDSCRHGLVKRGYEAILSQVTEGRPAAEARLIQDELAQAYGVSHLPVQQALLLLRDHAVLLEAPRRGFAVAPLNVECVMAAVLQENPKRPESIWKEDQEIVAGKPAHADQLARSHFEPAAVRVLQALRRRPQARRDVGSARAKAPI